MSMHTQDGTTGQLRNVKFDSASNRVTYEDEQGRELTMQKGDTIYKDGRPYLVARGMSSPRSQSHIDIPPIKELTH